MLNPEDHRWNSSNQRTAFLEKFEEWESRDWRQWLAEQLTFPFTARRDDDNDDAFFDKEAAAEPFRLGHKMQVVGLAKKKDERWGLLVRAQEKQQVGLVPLCDLKVMPRRDPNFWPVPEYVVWFANSR